MYLTILAQRIKELVGVLAETNDYLLKPLSFIFVS